MDEKMEEQYCNIFANEVLMPRQTFLQSIGEKRHDIALVELKNLQSEFGISVDALMYKARYLDVISENRYTTYWKKKNFDSNFKSQVEKSIIVSIRSTPYCKSQNNVVPLHGGIIFLILRQEYAI